MNEVLSIQKRRDGRVLHSKPVVSCGTGPTIPAIPVKAEEQVDFAPTTVDKSPKPST